VNIGKIHNFNFCQKYLCVKVWAQRHEDTKKQIFDILNGLSSEDCRDSSNAWLIDEKSIWRFPLKQ
jgi:hypothetical protein